MAGRTYDMTGRAGGNTEGFGARSNSMAAGRTGQAPAPEAHPTTGSGIRPQAGRRRAMARVQDFRGEAPRPPKATSAVGSDSPAPAPTAGGRQGYSSQSRSYAGGGSSGRSGGSYYGGGSRPSLDLNRPIMRQRAPSGGYYGGGRGYQRLRAETAVIRLPRVAEAAIAIPRRRAVAAEAAATVHGGGHGGGRR